MNSSSELILEVHGLEKSYHGGRLKALSPVNLYLLRGECLGVRGENGAGKSTLLSLISGSARPSGGTIQYAEGIRESISYIPQELSLYESLSVTDNLRFWGIAAGLNRKAIPIRIRWLLDALGLSDKAKAKVYECSGGMKRRLHLATGLMMTPKLLLLDEPTVGADEHSGNLIFSMLKRLKSQGCGIILVSHQGGELEGISDRIQLISKVAE